MGFYLRTSLRAGPFRLNLSPSGIGVSVGVPGFRVGAGPRGNYVRVGGRGVFYAGAAPKRPVVALSPGGPAAPPPDTGNVVMRELEGVSVQQLVAGNPSEIVQQIQKAAHRSRFWPVAAVLLGLISILTAPYGLVLALLGTPGVLWLRQRDLVRRSVVVFYEVTDAPAAHFAHLYSAHGFTAQSQRLWHVEASGDLTNPYQRKVNAGASALNRRSVAHLSVGGPPVLVTNIAVPSLNAKERSLYFLPDRVLVRHGNSYAEVPYASLRASASPQRFIEDGPLPADSQVVGTTWQYANVKGGPDRRFKNNRQIPIMLYGRLKLTSSQGFYMVWDFSRPDVAVALAEAINKMR